MEGRKGTPQLLQKADGRSDAQEEQSENITDGLSQRRRGSREASLDVKGRDESTGSVDNMTPDVEIGMSVQLVRTNVTGHLQRWVLAGGNTRAL